MMKRITAVLAAALGMGVAAPANAVDFKAGNWEMSVSGEVNAFAIFRSCQRSDVAFAGPVQACQAPVGSSHAGERFDIQSGLLPSALVTTVKTRQMNMDISATVGLYPGVGSNDPANQFAPTRTGAAQSTLDVRQNFLTFGDASWGSFKLGRDLGIFGDVILSDMTLLGVGSGGLGGYVTLGHIGTGYVYADWIPQITYTTPNMAGFQAKLSVMQGMDVGAFAQHETPMLQAQISYAMSGPIGGKIWVGGLFQDTKNSANGEGVTSVAGDAGVKVNVQNFEVVGYGYVGKGVGTLVIGAGGTASAVGDRRLSWGFLGQATAKFGKLKIGASYGESHLDLASGEAVSTLIQTNRSAVGGLYYGITDSLTLVGEFIHTRSRNHLEQEIHDNTGALGAILFF